MIFVVERGPTLSRETVGIPESDHPAFSANFREGLRTLPVKSRVLSGRRRLKKIDRGSFEGLVVGRVIAMQCEFMTQGQEFVGVCRIEAPFDSLDPTVSVRVTDPKTASDLLAAIGQVIAFRVADSHSPRAETERLGCLPKLELRSWELATQSSIIDDLREAGGSAWDNITDPDSFLREIRGKDVARHREDVPLPK